MTAVYFTDSSIAGPSGPILAWHWDFGDGSTSTVENPTHNYASSGTYTVTLRITGSGSDGSSTVTHTVTIGVPPPPLFASFTDPVSGLAVTFVDTSTPGPSGPITGWAWDFGDGNTSTLENPSHTYAAGGSYTVRLTVTGTSPDGTATATRTVTVVAPPVLTAAFTDTALGLAATFTDHSTPGPSGPITGWNLDYGDGSPHGTGAGPWTHTYAAAGTYNANLTVTSADGSASVTHPLTVASGGPGTLLDDFVSFTSWSRPAFTPSRSIQYHDEATFRAAISGLQAGDLIEPLPGCGEILIKNSSNVAFALSNKNPSGVAVVDLGTKKSIWNPGAESGDYVKFLYTGSGNFDPFDMGFCSNLRIYGGELADPAGGPGLIVHALTHDVLWYDGYVSSCGGSGVSVRGNTAGGVKSECYDLDFRFEVNRPGLNPAWDTHPDKGTGLHGLILHGNDGDIYGTAPGSCRFVIYCHDPLRPGEVSVGKTWPEGALGSACEQGNQYSSENYSNVYLYLYGENLLMNVNSSQRNPGSTAFQTGGNGLNNWGHAKLNGGKAWIWLVNCSGAPLHSDSGSWFPGSPVFTVERGRAHNTNQVHGAPGSNISVPYPPNDPLGAPLGIVYNDCAVV